MNNVVNIAVHHGGEIRAGVMDAMIGDAVLGEIVGADFLGAVTSTDEGFTGFGGGFHFFLFFLLEEAGAEDVHGFDAVLLLRTLVLHCYD